MCRYLEPLWAWPAVAVLRGKRCHSVRGDLPALVEPDAVPQIPGAVLDGAKLLFVRQAGSIQDARVYLQAKQVL